MRADACFASVYVLTRVSRPSMCDESRPRGGPGARPVALTRVSRPSIVLRPFMCDDNGNNETTRVFRPSKRESDKEGGPGARPGALTRVSRPSFDSRPFMCDYNDK